jgi:predicted DsbA family dithiol-disulfide isomerase
MKDAKTKLNILDDASSANSARTAPAVSQIGTADNIAFEIEVVSDVICPWCWVGKRRLEKAITLLGTDAKVTVTWRPFQLNPSMPKAGIDRNEYRRAKFGSLERSKELDARLTAVGATEGIEFRLDRIQRTPNTLDAHRLIWLAQKHGKQDAVVEALFKAYFVDGVDVGDPKNLVTIAISAGIEKALAEKMLATDEGLRAVVAEEEGFKAIGIDGVPGFVVNGQFLFSGAADPQVMAEAFRHATHPMTKAEADDAYEIELFDVSEEGPTNAIKGYPI